MILERLEQICLEDVYNRDQIRGIILKEIAVSDFSVQRKKAKDDLVIFFQGEYYKAKNKRLDEAYIGKTWSLDELIDEILVIVLQTEQSMKIQRVVGKLSPFFQMENDWDAIKVAADVVAVVGRAGFYHVIPARDSVSGSIEVQSRFKMAPEVKERIEKMEYLPPLVCPPAEITSNYQSAYFTKRDSVILGKHNHHNLPQALDVINIANSIPLALDLEVIKDDEKPNHKLDSVQKMNAWQRLKTVSKQMYQRIIGFGNRFYLSWKYDKRGRFYSLGYHINIQATEYKKALINLANEEVIKLK